MSSSDPIEPTTMKTPAASPLKSSLRVRLTFWNVGVLAVALLLVAVLMVGMTQYWVAKSIDDELAMSGQRMNMPRQMVDPGGFGPRFGPLGNPLPGPRNGQGNRGPQSQPQDQKGQGNQTTVESGSAPNQGFDQRGDGPGNQGPQGNSPDGQAGQRPPRLPELDPNSFDPQGKRLYEIRRPRFLNDKGLSVDQNSNDVAWDRAAGIAAATKGHNIFSTVSVEDMTLRIISVPKRLQDGRTFVIQVASDLTALNTISRAQTTLLFILVPAAIVLAAAGGLILTRKALKPIEEVTTAAELIDESNLDQRLPVTGNDELGRLASKFNEMVARLDDAFHRQKQLLESQKRFTADASHELRTPLTRIKIATGNALDPSADDSDRIHGLQVIDQAADAMSHLVGQLLTIARNDTVVAPTDKTANVPDSLAKAVELAGLSGDPRLRIDSAPLKIQMDPDHLTQILTNLLSNASRHTPAKGKIQACLELDPPSLQISDSGEGISESDLPNLGKRFFRADTARNRNTGGNGLGLSIVDSILKMYGYSWTVTSHLGEGTTIRLTFVKCESPSPDSD